MEWLGMPRGSGSAACSAGGLASCNKVEEIDIRHYIIGEYRVYGGYMEGIQESGSVLVCLAVHSVTLMYTVDVLDIDLQL